MSRRQGRTDVTGPLGVVLDAPDVLWAGRIATNPVHRIAAAGGLAGARSPARDRQCHQPRPPARGLRSSVSSVVLSVPLSDTWIDIQFTLPATTVDGGAPVVSTEDAAAAMRSVLAIAAGVDGPEALPAVARRGRRRRPPPSPSSGIRSGSPTTPA